MLITFVFRSPGPSAALRPKRRIVKTFHAAASSSRRASTQAGASSISSKIVANNDNEVIFRRDWGVKENVVRYLNRVLGVAEAASSTVDPSLYYRLSREVLLANNGRGILSRFGSSPLRIVQFAFPEVNWKPWLFSRVPRAFWSDPKNIVNYLDWLLLEMKWRSTDDLHGISRELLEAHHGAGLLSAYRYSPLAILLAAYPDYEWHPWRFDNVPSSYWSDAKNVCFFLQNLHGKLLLGSDASEWYKVTSSDFIKHQGGGLLSFYKGSVASILSFAYPTVSWKPWLFHSVPHGFWNKKENVIAYLDWVKEKLVIEKPVDWYDIDRVDLKELHGYSLLKSHGSIHALLKFAYPTMELDPLAFTLGRTTQKLIYRALKKLLEPAHPVKFDYLHPTFKFKESGVAMSFDCFVMSLDLAVEYQGEFHSQPKPYGSRSKAEKELTAQRARDAEKRQCCALAGITLIEVPYSWQREISQKGDDDIVRSLGDMLLSYRPDLQSVL